MKNSIEKTLSMRKGFNDIQWKNRFFEKKIIYEPVKDWVCDMGFAGDLYSYFIELEKSLPLLRKSILDESLPKYVFGMRGLFAGGRVTDAMILGMFEYSEALPELLEVAQHDLNDEMRAVCAESIGEMKKEAWNLAPYLCNRLVNDKSAYTKEHIAKTLGKIENPFAINPLRETIDETILRMRDYDSLGYPFKDLKNKWEKQEADSTCMLLENSIVALFKLNQKQGREVLSQALDDRSHLVYHWAKRAVHWCDYYERKRRD